MGERAFGGFKGHLDPLPHTLRLKRCDATKQAQRFRSPRRKRFLLGEDSGNRGNMAAARWAYHAENSATSIPGATVSAPGVGYPWLAR